MSKDDPVNPNHYKGAKGFEAIDVMEAAATNAPNPFQAHLQCTSLKYLFRLWRKDLPLQDAKKAKWYLDRLIQELETEEYTRPSSELITKVKPGNFGSATPLDSIRMDFERGKLSRHEYEIARARILGRMDEDEYREGLARLASQDDR